MVCTPVCARVFFLATFVAKNRLRKFEFRGGRQRPDTAAPERGLWGWLQLRKFLPQAGGRPGGRFLKTSSARLCWCYFLCLCLVVCGFFLCFSLCFFLSVCLAVCAFFLCFLRCFFLCLCLVVCVFFCAFCGAFFCGYVCAFLFVLLSIGFFCFFSRKSCLAVCAFFLCFLRCFFLCLCLVVCGFFLCFLRCFFLLACLLVCAFFLCFHVFESPRKSKFSLRLALCLSNPA